jgi:2-iminobutanoate/2-iminopropanoate deaminase
MKCEFCYFVAFPIYRSITMTRLIPSVCTALAVLLFASLPSTQAAEIARFDDGPFAGMGYPFSESARAADLLFLAGQIGEDADGKLVPGGIQGEAEQMMLNIEATLARRGLTMEHVVKCTVFLADIDEWGAFNEVYKKHFSPPYPARSAMAASGLVGKARVEMDCIAGYPD